MKTAVGSIRQNVRVVMRSLGVVLDKLSGGRLTPNGVTIIGFWMHVPIAYFVATGQWVLAGVLAIVFGLFDTLDGELARLQARVSDYGGLLDAVTDRLKEVLLYTGAAYYFAVSAPADQQWYAALAVVACGTAITVSFVKSKGETMLATKSKHATYATLNKVFAGGLFPFEVRMVVFIAGLLMGWLAGAMVVLTVFSSLAVWQRLRQVRKAI